MTNFGQNDGQVPPSKKPQRKRGIIFLLFEKNDAAQKFKRRAIIKKSRQL
jgi:hypothetical protein